MGQIASRQDDLYGPEAKVFLPEGDQNQYVNSKKRFKHPMAALFHFVFKTSAFFIYLFGGIFGQDFKSTFVLIVLLISMDFWIVKNVTGRLLAGLRWSNYVDEEGNSHWIFENKAAINKRSGFTDFQEEVDSNKNQTADSSMFWTGLILAPTFWSLMFLVCLLRLNLQWLMIVVLAFVLSFSNLYGYLRCRLGTSDLKSSLTQFVAKQVFYNFITGGSSQVKPMP